MLKNIISNQLNDHKISLILKIVICAQIINLSIRFINFGARLSNFFHYFNFYACMDLYLVHI